MAQKGFYLYAVRPVNYKTTVPEIKGIDNRGHVFTTVVGDQIEAIVSLVSLKDFVTAEIKERAQNDLQWIKEKSMLHNHVVMQSAEGTEGAIVPMKFGLIFKNRESLSRAIKKDSTKFFELFQKLKGKEEWSVKVFAGPTFKEAVIKNEPALRSRKEEIASMPAGLAYFEEKELEDEAEKRQREETRRLSQEVTEILRKFVDEAKFGKILGKELTMKAEPMILNAIFLINKTKLDKFFKEAEKVQGMLEKQGLTIEMSGPWPPYNFI